MHFIVEVKPNSVKLDENWKFNRQKISTINKFKIKFAFLNITFY